MGNHWHFVVWPQETGALTDYFRWLAHTHAMRWRASHNTVGYGRLYRGRYKSFPVQPGAAMLKVCRYVERNAFVGRAGGTSRGLATVELMGWRAWHSRSGIGVDRLADASAGQLAGSLEFRHTAKQRSRWQLSLARSQPLRDDAWTLAAAKEFGLEYTMRAEGGAHGTKGKDGDEP